MKPLVFVALFVCLFVAGCKPKPSVQKGPRFSPLQNGFGVVVQPIGIDSGPGAELFFKGTNETPVLVWPHIGTSGYPILYSNDVALLMADKPDQQGRLGGGAVILVQAAGPAMDISNDLLRVYAERTNVNLNTLLGIYNPLRLIQSNGEITVTYLPALESRITTSLKFPITWEDIFSIMDDVKRTGRTNTVTNTDLLYLQKDYGESIK